MTGIKPTHYDALNTDKGEILDNFRLEHINLTLVFDPSLSKRKGKVRSPGMPMTYRIHLSNQIPSISSTKVSQLGWGQELQMTPLIEFHTSFVPKKASSRQSNL